jgi:alginate O-acetyltransferase complex protein AlgI
MVFNSIQFFLFFTVTVILYYLIPLKFRWMFLLAGSIFFYIFVIPYTYIIQPVGDDIIDRIITLDK